MSKKLAIAASTLLAATGLAFAATTPPAKAHKHKKAAKQVAMKAPAPIKSTGAKTPAPAAAKPAPAAQPAQPSQPAPAKSWWHFWG